MNAHLSGPRVTSQKVLFSWPAGLMTGACLLLGVLLIGIMIMLIGHLRGAHFFSDAGQECRAIAAYAQTYTSTKIDPVLRQNMRIDGEDAVGVNDLDCSGIFQASGLDISPDCQPKRDGLCVPFQIVFGRAWPDEERGNGFKLTVDHPCAGLCGFGQEVDFAPAGKGEWKAIREREVWVS